MNGTNAAKRLGVAGVVFFAIKGCVWLAIALAASNQIL